MISVHSNPASMLLRVAALALTIFVFSDGDGNAQSRATQGSASSEGPFSQLAGSWSGSGTIDLSNGRTGRSSVELPMTCWRAKQASAQYPLRERQL